MKPMDPSGTKWDEFDKKFRAKYSEEPDVYAAYAYDIVMILTEAVKADKTTGPEIRDYLLKMESYEGITGTTEFDVNGDCNTKPFARQVIRDGRYDSAAQR